MASCLVRLRKKTFPVGSVVLLTMMVTYFGIALFPPLWNFAISLSFFPIWGRIALAGPVVFYGMDSFLVSLLVLWVLLGLSLLVTLLALALRMLFVLILLLPPLPGTLFGIRMMFRI